MTQRIRPIIGIPCDHRMIGPHPFHAVGEKYIAAARDGAGGLPWLVPALEPAISASEILNLADAILFTGSPSNVAPRHYGGTPPREGVLQDERRDDTTLPLLRAAIAHGVPVLCICRGFQELNVAFGGTLHQHLNEVSGRIDHREDKTATLDVQYAPIHDVTLSVGGQLHSIAERTRITVNSLHGQGIDRLAPALLTEATADDGTIEAVAVQGAKNFALGVQWHPEWRFWEDAFSSQLFKTFGAAAAAHARARQKAHA